MAMCFCFPSGRGAGLSTDQGSSAVDLLNGEFALQTNDEILLTEAERQLALA